MTKQRNLWIVVADGEHARILAPSAQGALRTARRIDSATAHLRSSDLGTDRPGRVHESATAARHGAEPRTDPHDAAKAAFARDLGHQLVAAARAGDFDDIVLVAPSPVLAILQDCLDGASAANVRGALAKDLTKVPDHELQPHLGEWVRPPAPG